MANRAGKATFGHRRKLPSGNYQASYVGPDGQRHLAPVTFPSAADADEWLANRRTDIGRGEWRRPALGRQRLDEYAIAWLQAATLTPKTRAGYASLLDNHILIDLPGDVPGLGQMTLAQIDPTAVKVWWADRLKRGAPTARARAYAVLRTIFNEAVRDGAVVVNPCTIRGAGKTSHPERKPATVAQLNVIAERMPPRYRMLALTAAWSQARFGELTELRRKDIDLVALSIRIDRAVSEVDGIGFVVGPPKGTDEGRRTIHLPESLRAGLEAHLETFVAPGDDELVFATRNRTYLSSRNAARYVKVATIAAGVPGMHFHDLRHTGATIAAQAGATTKEMMARMGQTTPRAALIYQHAVSDRDKAIADALSEAATHGGNVVPLRPRRAARDAAKRVDGDAAGQAAD